MNEDTKVQKRCNSIIKNGHCKALSISKGDEYLYTEDDDANKFCDGCDFIRQVKESKED